METVSQKSSVQPKTKQIPEDMLKILSAAKTKASIEKDLNKLKDIDEEMENVSELAIAPNLTERDDALVILVYLKKNDSICPSFIQQIITRATNCKEEDLIILTTHKISNFLKHELIEQEQYDKLLHASLPLKYFQAETNQQLNKLFDEKYEEFLELRSSGSNIQAPEVVDNEIELSQSDEQTSQFEITSLSLKDISEEWDPEIKTYPEYKAEEIIAHLKSLADYRPDKQPKKRQETISESTQKQPKKPRPAISEKECNKIIEEYKSFSDVQEGRTTPLHLAAAKFAPHQKVKLPKEQAIAVVKKLLGVDRNLEAGQKIKISPSREILNINFQDEEGKTALHCAATSSGGIIYWLLVMKADPTIRDKNGKTFFDYIPKNWHLIKDSAREYIKYWDQK